jgi:hypothetical protein
VRCAGFVSEGFVPDGGMWNPTQAREDAPSRTSGKPRCKSAKAFAVKKNQRGPKGTSTYPSTMSKYPAFFLYVSGFLLS